MTRKVFKDKAALIGAVVGPDDRVLDVGFLGQGIQMGDPSWPHALLREAAAEVYGVDLSIDRTAFPDASRYQEGDAESFSFPGVAFDAIFAGDLIEHLPNPGLFLASARAHMQAHSTLVLTTPNTFNLFNLAEKLTKDEPTVNADHTCYFNHKTIRVLLDKCGFQLAEIHYVYTLGYTHPESLRKKALNVLYRFVSFFTPKFIETLVITANVKTA